MSNLGTNVKPLIMTQSDSAPAVEREVRIAAAALLLEMAYSDSDFVYAEAKTALRMVQRAFAVEKSEALNIISAAKALRCATYSVEDFASVILAAVGRENRKMLLAMVIRVMISDGVIAGSEERLTRRLQQLLRLTDAEEREAFHLAVLASKVGQAIEGEPYPFSIQSLVYDRSA